MRETRAMRLRHHLPSCKLLYTPLQSDGSIRLLELHQPIANRLSASLREFPLSKSPPYEALSYTWGTAVTPFSIPRHPSSSSTSSHSISCNGVTLPLPQNLHDALLVLSKDSSSSFGWPQRSKYLWVDALSINQSDIPERNAQVKMMSDIFQRAESIIAWLGVEDQFTDDALAVINGISAITDEAYAQDSAHFTKFFSPVESLEFYNSLGIELLTFSHWLGFLCLLSRPWFKRAWIVQEIALAKSVTVMIGSKRLPWERLDKVLSFLRATRWYRHLSTNNFLGLSYLSEDIRERYRDFLWSDTHLGHNVLSLARTRRAFSVYSAHPKARKPSLGALIETHRYTLATDARDKVYAFLGLADKQLPPFSEFPGLGEPNYGTATRDVYVQVSACLLLSYKNLNTLSHVEPREHTRVKGLPSWVPDYSVPCETLPLAARGRFCWSASGDLPWTPNATALQEGSLDVQGYRFDVVDEVAMTRIEAGGSKTTWESVYNLAAGLAAKYRIPDGRGEHHSPFEVVWRTLMADTYDGRCPAPDFCGEILLRHLLNHRAPYQSARWQSTIGEYIPPAYSVPVARHASLARILGLGADTELALDEWASRPGHNTHDAPPTLRQTTHFWHEVHTVSLSRRLFRTVGGLFGIGPAALKSGDEVWILGGAQVPFILRRNMQSSHRLVGEAYVHGMMHMRHPEVLGRIEHAVLE